MKFGILFLAIGFILAGCKEESPIDGDESSENPQMPRILSPSDRSTSNIGAQMNVSVSGNNIEVKYVGLNGSPNPSNTNESEKGFYTGFMYEQGSNKFYFTPNNAIWSNKWVKIIAHDKISDKWSEPVYVKIQGTMQPTYENPSPVNSGNTGYWSRVKGNINANYNYDKIPTVKSGSLTLLEMPIRGIYLSKYTYSKNGDGSVKVSFTAHNRMVSFGKVSVCNANGQEIESRMIQPYSGNITGLFDWFIEGFELAKDFGSMLTGQWGAMNAKETKIEVTIPKDGFLTITNDSSIEGVTFACNLISIVSSAISVSSSFKTDFESIKSETFISIFEQEFSKSIVYSLKDLNKLTDDDIDIILQFALEFCSSDEGINLLGYLLINETKNALSGIADASLAKLSMGASSVVFGIGKVKEAYDQIKSMASSWDDGYAKITNNDGLTEDIHNIIPEEYIETLKELGLEIYGGNNPPFIEGSYLTAPMQKVRANFFEWGSPTYNAEITFYNQNFSNLTIQMDSRTFNKKGFVDNSDESAEGIGAFIVGRDNFFSIFMESITLDVYGHTTEVVSVISGELVEGGIRNYQTAGIMVNDHGDPRNIYIENGQGRLWKDGDGFSERINLRKTQVRSTTVGNRNSHFLILK